MLNLLAFFEEGFLNIFLDNLLIGIIPLIIILLIIILIVKISNKKSSKDRKKFIKLLKEDNDSNFSRTKDIDKDFFYIPDINILPIKDYDSDSKIFSRQKKAIEMIDKKMVKFKTEKSNIELKKMFGASNLEYIIRYEENFARYMQSLRLWAESLLEINDTESAKIILKESISAGSEISYSYTILADIYFKNKDNKEILRLKTIVENSNFPAKLNVLSYINSLLQKIDIENEVD